MRRDDWLVHQLPVGMTEDDFLRRFLSIFQSVGDSVLAQIDVIDRQFDPTVAPDPMVREMGQWIGLEWLDSSHPDVVQRQAVLEYASLLRWRGTKRGMEALLRFMSGGGEVLIDDSGGIYAEGEAPRDAPHVRMAMSDSILAHTDDVIRIIRSELPASVTFQLAIGDEVVWPPSDRGSGTERADQEVH
ncbi:MAG: phage tail protein [Acidimicrobiaceae bacterium]|nr:phage tail protein [Acidimicrobiaceae bacterium]